MQIITYPHKLYNSSFVSLSLQWGRCGHDYMVVGFTATYANCAYRHQSCEFEPRSWRGVLDTTLYDKVCQ